MDARKLWWGLVAFGLSAAIAPAAAPAATGRTSGTPAERAAQDDWPRWWRDIGGFFDPAAPYPPAESFAVDINDFGVVVGMAGNRGFRYVVGASAASYIGGSDADAFRPEAVNSDGIVAGSITAPSTNEETGPSHAAVWYPSTNSVVDLGGLPGPGWTIPFDINDEGIVVGLSANRSFAYDLDTETMTDLGLMGGAQSIPSEVSDDGLVVGEVRYADSSMRGFAHDLVTDETVVLDTLPGDGLASAIGSSPIGVIVGWAIAEDATTHVVTWDADNHAITDHGAIGPGSSCTPTDVNDAGVVVGSCQDIEWGPAFRLDLGAPEPEFVAIAGPASAVVFGGGGGSPMAINADGVLAGSASFEGVNRAAIHGPWTFRDVPDTHPFFWDVGWMVANGITTGYDDGRFRPTDPVTRQSMAAFMYRLAGSPSYIPTNNDFSDLGGIRHRKEVEWLANQGIAGGFPDGTFRPKQSVTRQSMAAFLYRLAGSPEFEPPADASFTDTSPDHPFFAEIEWLASVGVTTGYADGGFHPASIVTRQAMSAFLHRFDASPGVGI